MSLVIKTVSDSRDAQRDLDSLGKTVDSIESKFDKLSDRLSNAFKVLSIGIAAGASSRAITGLTDRFTELENKIRSATETQEDFNFAVSKLQETAIKTRSALTSITALYARISLNSNNLGINQTDIIKVTSTVAKTLKLSGATTAEATSSLQQFAQAIGSATLAGDELRSILENNGVLAKVIAEGFGTTADKLKKLGEEGKLKSVQLLKGILEQADAVDKKFQTLKITYSDAFLNLSTSLAILYNNATKAIFGSSGAIAKFINNIAERIFAVASVFEVYFYNMKASVKLFVFESIESLAYFYDYLRSWLKDVGKRISDGLESWFPGSGSFISGMLNNLQTLASAISATFSEFINNIFTAGTFKELFSRFVAFWRSVIDKIVGFVRNTKIDFFNIDFSSFFNKLQPVYSMLSKWIHSIESLFAWLYDRVVGNSWVPDLVIEVRDWFSKLREKPAADIKTFTENAEGRFEKLYKKIKGFVWKQPEEPPQDKPNFVVKKLEKTFGTTSPFVRTIKQLFGLPDRYAGAIAGVEIDTKAKVGRGPRREQDERPFAHDVINALPPGFQIGLAATFGAAITGILFKLFQEGPLRSIVLTLWTVTLSSAVSRVIDGAVIRNAVFGLANRFLEIINFGLNKLLNGNAIGDPLGLLFFLAKLALVFKAGREALGKAAIAVASSPTNIAKSFGRSLDLKALNSSVSSANESLINTPQRLNSQRIRAYQTESAAIQNLANLTDKAGNRIGDLQAKALVASKNLSSLSSASAFQARSFISAAESAQKSTIKSTEALAKFYKDAPNVTATRDRNVALADALRTQMQEAREATKARIKDVSGSVGGVIGGVAGFQIGTELAKGFSQEWQKLAISLSGAVIGQGIGAAIGYVLSASLIGVFTRGAAIIAASIAATNPFILGATILFASLYAAYELFRDVPGKWAKQISSLFFKPPTESESKAVSNEPVGKMSLYEVFSTFTQAVRDAVSQSFSDGLDRLAQKFFLPKPKSTEYKASGGIIRGPGSGTSDSIPAMLSNGEYVVNAAATKRYGGLLEKINNGEPVRFFQSGGAVNSTVSQAPTGVVKVAVVEDRTTDPLIKSVENSFGIKLPEFFSKAISTVRGAFSSPKAEGQPTSLQDQVSAAKTVEDSLKILSKGIKDTGLTIDDKLLATQSRRMLKELAEAADKVNRFERVARRFPDSPIGADAKEEAAEGRGIIARLLTSAGIPFEKPSRLEIKGGDVDEKDKLKVGDQYGIITEVFPKIALTTEEFFKFSDSLRNMFFKMAVDIKARETQLNEIDVGTLKSPKEVRNIADKRTSIESDRGFSEVVLAKELEAFRTPFETFKNKLSAINLNVSEELYNILDIRDVERVGGLAKRIADAYKVIKAPSSDTSITKELRQNAANVVIEKSKALEEAFNDALLNVSLNYRTINNALQNYSLEISREIFNSLNNAERSNLIDFVRNIKQATESARLATTDEARKAANELVDAYEKQFGKFVTDRTDTRKIAGKEFQQQSAGVVQGSLSAALKGNRDPDKSSFEAFRDNLLDGFTSNVIDTLVAGLTKSIFSTALSGFLEKLGGGIFGLGSGEGLVPDMFGKTPLTPLYVKQVDDLMGVGDAAINGLDLAPGDTKMGAGGGAGGGIFSKMLGGVKSLFKGFDLSKMLGGIGDFFKTGLSSFTKLLGFADGGKISGRGTGTSDSIPALLSNGEFVVNAQSTKRFEPLLRSINNGTFGKFATGGLVGATVGNLGDMQIEPSGGNSTVVNLTITGDISRQTKSTIYEMLPQIAAGVNKRNREKG